MNAKESSGTARTALANWLSISLEERMALTVSGYGLVTNYIICYPYLIGAQIIAFTLQFRVMRNERNSASAHVHNSFTPREVEHEGFNKW